MRIEFYEPDDDPRYMSVYLEGYELGVFHPSDPRLSLDNLIHEAYERGMADSRKKLQRELQLLIGVNK